jgi:hypothetical protein
MDPSSVCTWGDYPPPLRQIQIERDTAGKLRAEPNCFETKRKGKAPGEHAQAIQDETVAVLRQALKRRDGPNSSRESR